MTTWPVDVSDEQLASVAIEPKPGQLWRWVFSIGDAGSWLIQHVTTESRETFLAGGFSFIKRGELFTIVNVNDPGPTEMNLPKVDDNGLITFDPPKRWHVVLWNGLLCYFQHDWLGDGISELVKDVP